MRGRIELLLAVLFIALTVFTCCGCSSSSSKPSNTTHSISGTVTTSGAALQGVMVSLNTGTTTTTDANGNFFFASLANGSYTVTPSMTGYTLSPTSSLQTVNNANITGVNFTVSAATGVGVFDGSYTGTWDITCPACGDTAAGTFTTILTNGVFTNISLPITSGAHGPLMDSGTVSSSGAIIGTGTNPSQCNNNMSTFAGQITTISSGVVGLTISYSRLTYLDGCEAESGTIIATRTTAGTTPIYSISGSVTAAGTGSAIQGVTITLTSAGTSIATATTDASGNYTFAGLINGSYTITPSMPGYYTYGTPKYSFWPISITQTVNGANVTGVTFTGYPPACC